MSTDAAAAAAEPPQAKPPVSPVVDAANGMDSDASDAEGPGEEASKKKKKRKPKKKKKTNYAESGGGIPPEPVIPTMDAESEADAARWAHELAKGVKKVGLEPYAVLFDRERDKLNLLRTASCAGFKLRTPRFSLRQVEPGDTTAIRRIKMEPIVQRTQLYGTPSASDIKQAFQTRYVLSSIPRLDPPPTGAWRDEYVFAITAKDPKSIKIQPAGQVRIAHRISGAEGYLGNFALSLETKASEEEGGNDSVEGMRPQPGVVWRQPTSEMCAKAGLVGKMFYEIHPQLWGQGIMSEVFAEVLRFAVEEVGCQEVWADPTTGNEPSIKLCTKNGLSLHHESADNSFRKTQLFHRITRDEWFARNRPHLTAASTSGTTGSAAATVNGSHTAVAPTTTTTDGPAATSPTKSPYPDPWGGKPVCRWCLDFRLPPPTFVCACGWARYCSRECQRADWVFRRGHMGECTAK